MVFHVGLFAFFSSRAALEQSHLMTQCKLALCELLQLALDIRLDYRISCFLVGFKARVTAAMEAEARERARPKAAVEERAGAALVSGIMNIGQGVAGVCWHAAVVRGMPLEA